jgi:hypothetical protein
MRKLLIVTGAACDRVYTVKANTKGLKPLAPCRFKVDATGSASSRPGVDCIGVDQPAWSPDGSKIAFQNCIERPVAKVTPKARGAI